MVIDVVPKGDQTSEEWIAGKSTTYPDKWVLGKPLTYYESHKKIKDVTVGGVATQILVEDWEYASGGITFVPRGNYVYVIASGGQLERLQNSAEITITDKILSTFKFIK